MIQAYRLALAKWDEASSDGMIADDKGKWVLRLDHEEAVRELVEALEALVSDVNRSDYHTRRIAFEQASAAIARARENNGIEGASGNHQV